MSYTWIQMRVGLADEHEVCVLSERTGVDADTIAGKLLRFWGWADRLTDDGHIDGVSLATVDRIAGLPGFGAAMVEVDWVRVTDGGLELPRFGKYMSQSARKRAVEAKGKAETRRAARPTNGRQADDLFPPARAPQRLPEPDRPIEVAATSPSGGSTPAAEPRGSPPRTNVRRENGQMSGARTDKCPVLPLTLNSSSKVEESLGTESLSLVDQVEERARALSRGDPPTVSTLENSREQTPRTGDPPAADAPSAPPIEGFSREACAGLAGEIFRRLALARPDRLPWQVAFLVDRGLVSSHQVQDALAGAKACRPSKPVAWFRRTLAENVAKGRGHPSDDGHLEALIRRVELPRRFDARPPERTTPELSIAAATLAAPPSIERKPDLETRRGQALELLRVKAAAIA